MLFPWADVRTRVYVDGFNLYYGALKGTPFKWLDPVRLAALLLPREYAIDRLRYFTARVSGKLDSRAPARQQNYLKALSTLPEVDIHYGRFLAKTAWRPLANLPVAGKNDTNLDRWSRRNDAGVRMCPEATRRGSGSVRIRPAS